MRMIPVASRLAPLALLAVAACGTPAPMSPADMAVTTDLAAAADLAVGGSADMAKLTDGMSVDPQRPPTTSAKDLEDWLATGAYKAWACEKDAHPARPGSAHAANRICSNDSLSNSASGEYPVGAASVKELFNGAGALIGYAVGVRLKTGATDDAWFWYERVGGSVYGPGAGVAICANCHKNAPRDYIYTQVKR